MLDLDNSAQRTSGDEELFAEIMDVDSDLPAEKAVDNELDGIDDTLQPKTPKKTDNKDSEGIDYEARYRSSTSENMKLREKLDKLKPVVPVQDLLEADPQFRDYLLAYRKHKPEAEKIEFLGKIKLIKQSYRNSLTISPRLQKLKTSFKCIFT